jgi:signal transduction histidine kinase
MRVVRLSSSVQSRGPEAESAAGEELSPGLSDILVDPEHMDELHERLNSGGSAVASSLADVALTSEAERAGRRVAVLELEDPDGTTWVQEVMRLESDEADVASVHDVLGGQNATAVFTYQLRMDGPGTGTNLNISGPSGGRIIPIPTTGVKQAVEQASQRLLVGTGIILLLGLVLAAVVAHRVTAPLRGLAGAARSVGGGAFGTVAPASGGGEVREAIVSFNRMSTHLKELDETASRLRAREHLTELGEIARGLAHTLRNPLNALGLSLEELAGQARDPEKAEELVLGARRQIRRVDGSVRSFLALASERGGHVEAVDLYGMVQDVALEASQDSAHSVRLDIQPVEKPLTVQAVAPELRAVIQALVVNAVEASPEKGTVAIRLTPSHAAGMMRIDIQDQGAGLPDEVRQKLFTPHVTTKANGSGMGLYLAQRITTTRYGGSVNFEDTPQGGTRVVLEFGDREEATHE